LNAEPLRRRRVQSVKRVTAMKDEAKLWWLLLLVAVLGGAGMALAL
jgi:hypothetical protein